MGVHAKQRELEELRQHYMKKSSCILLVVVALLVGAFIGNAITMVYMGRQNVQVASPQSSPNAQSGAHAYDPAALAELEAAAAKNPTNAEHWAKLGNFCFDHDLPEKAVAAYERAVELKPMQIGVWSDLGVMYRRTGQFEKALDAFSHAAQLDPKHAVSRFNMGVVYLHDLNDRDGALKVWKEVLAIDPEAKAPNGKPVADLVRELQ